MHKHLTILSGNHVTVETVSLNNLQNGHKIQKMLTDFGEHRGKISFERLVYNPSKDSLSIAAALTKS
jgi:hypothetical protein